MKEFFGIQSERNNNPPSKQKINGLIKAYGYEIVEKKCSINKVQHYY